MQDPSPSADLTSEELIDLVQRVFAPRADEHRMAILVDLPDRHVPDHDEWRDRRHMAMTWQHRLAAAAANSGLQCDLFAYANVRANNADLPATAVQVRAPGISETSAEGPSAETAERALRPDALAGAPERTFEDIFRQYPILIAATQFSATAPLKLMSARHGCRAATMPGFNRSMIDALRLDYVEVDRQVRRLADRLSAAQGADFHFRVGETAHSLHLDLRHRHGHASGGLVQQPGQAGNLPSGEAYIVPYEGEVADQPSRSRGVLPVQLDDEVVLFRIAENRAVEVLSSGPRSDAERQHLAEEPAYGNMAELGLGVLAGFGIQPVGRLLLDEKLGLHIAFGRSDHFGGQVGARQFSRPQAVIHIDRVYLPQTQPMVQVERMDLVHDDGPQVLMRDGRYV